MRRGNKIGHIKILRPANGNEAVFLKRQNIRKQKNFLKESYKINKGEITISKQQTRRLKEA